jgi:hypothetical protein
VVVVVDAAPKPLLVRVGAGRFTWHVAREMDYALCGEPIGHVLDVWIGLRVTMCRRCKWIMARRAKFGKVPQDD